MEFYFFLNNSETISIGNTRPTYLVIIETIKHTPHHTHYTTTTLHYNYTTLHLPLIFPVNSGNTFEIDFDAPVVVVVVVVVVWGGGVRIGVVLG